MDFLKTSVSLDINKLQILKPLKASKLLVLLFVISSSCSNKRPQNFCYVNIDSLLKGVDTNRYERIEYPNENLVEIFDKQNSLGERGLFKFDSLGHLQFYAFLDSSDNGYNYSISFDSLGNKVDSTGGEVVQWYFKFPKNKSVVEVSFLLCAVESNFGSIKLESMDFAKSDIKLFEGRFLKLIGGTVEVPLDKINAKREVYLSGEKETKCNKQFSRFRESVIVLQPDDTLSKR